MLIFSRYNLVLLAVPKTGSTALEVALGQEADGRFGNPPEMKHLPLYRYNRFVRPLLQLTTGQDPETFALIREPISWLRSWYRYRARNSMALLPTSTCHISFDQFVREAMSDDPPPFAQVGCQTRFLSPGGSGGPITHLFQYEQMDLACKFLENRLELELDLPWLNQAAIGPAPLDPDLEAQYRRSMRANFNSGKTLLSSARPMMLAPRHPERLGSDR
ncbi:sulfotransferase family protein [Planktomarina temperata]|nr:sulfotransferase family protein [Planktomarina temperata]